MVPECYVVLIINQQVITVFINGPKYQITKKKRR